MQPKPGRKQQPAASEGDDDDAGAQETELVQADTLKKGQKCSLRDGEGALFAYTFVVDPEPQLPKNVGAGDANVGDYLLVAGKKSRHLGAMAVVTGWERYELFKKEKTQNLLYADWPGVLMSDYSFFKHTMTPGKLATLDTFLIQKGHVSSVLKEKKQKR